MEGLFAQLDNQGKISGFEAKQNQNQRLKFKNLNLNKLKDYFNKYGYIKAELNIVELDKYITNTFYSHLQNKDIKHGNDISRPFLMASFMTSFLGLFVLYTKNVETFSDFLGHGNIYENFASVEPEIQQGSVGTGFLLSNVRAAVAEQEILPETQQGGVGTGISLSNIRAAVAEQEILPETQQGGVGTGIRPLGLAEPKFILPSQVISSESQQGGVGTGIRPLGLAEPKFILPSQVISSESQQGGVGTGIRPLAEPKFILPSQVISSGTQQGGVGTGIRPLGLAEPKFILPSQVISSESQQVLPDPKYMVPTTGLGQQGIGFGEKKIDSITVLIPKVLFTNEKDEFLDFLYFGLPLADSTPDDEKNFKALFILFKRILNKLSAVKNPEIRIANTIGLLLRISIFHKILENQNQIRGEEYLHVLDKFILESINDIPYDECVFYSDNLNFVKFTPNMCARAKEEKKQLTTKCPVVEQKCPVVEQKCPVVEQKCPVVEQKCPVVEQKCEPCEKTTCQETEEPSSLWKYTSVLLTMLVIILVFMLVFGSTSPKPNIKNLAKIK